MKRIEDDLDEKMKESFSLYNELIDCIKNVKEKSCYFKLDDEMSKFLKEKGKGEKIISMLGKKLNYYEFQNEIKK